MAVEKSCFGTLSDGREAAQFTLTNGNGMTLVVTSYGCRILELLVPDRQGRLGNVVLGHRTLEEYLGADYQGACVGRYANRIGGASFTLDGAVYPLAKNDGENTLHGGPGGFHQKIWEATVQDGDEPAVTFTTESPDGEEGYPGRLQVQVTYRLTRENALSLEYQAVSYKKTPFNPTNHSFFNLSGDPQKEVLDTVLQLHAAHSTQVTDDLIPTGELVPVAGGPLDFTQGKPLGQDIFAPDPLVQLCGGFDHNFCVDGEGFRLFATAQEPESGRVMEVWSDLPGVQLYTFNKVDAGLLGRDGLPMKPHTAFCLETQFYPDSVHHSQFPFTWLEPGVPFSTKTVYRFSVSS